MSKFSRVPLYKFIMKIFFNIPAMMMKNESIKSNTTYSSMKNPQVPRRKINHIFKNYVQKKQLQNWEGHI